MPGETKPATCDKRVEARWGSHPCVKPARHRGACSSTPKMTAEDAKRIAQETDIVRRIRKEMRDRRPSGVIGSTTWVIDRLRALEDRVAALEAAARTNDEARHG